MIKGAHTRYSQFTRDEALIFKLSVDINSLLLILKATIKRALSLLLLFTTWNAADDSFIV